MNDPGGNVPEEREDMIAGERRKQCTEDAAQDTNVRVDGGVSTAAGGKAPLWVQVQGMSRHSGGCEASRFHCLDEMGSRIVI